MSEHDREWFATTRWSRVVAAVEAPTKERQTALAWLCEAYWYPLYVFVRRRGHGPDDAQDLTQAFFERFLEKEFVQDANRDRGRFRAFLLGCLKHFLANESDRARAKKRGGGVAPLSIDVLDAESRYGIEPSTDLTPEKLFERRWALTILGRTIVRLEEEMRQAGKGRSFEVLRGHLAAGGASFSYAEAAEQLDLTENAARVAAHRLRGRYRDLLRDEIAQTVSTPEEIDDEIRHLMDALAT